MKFQVASVLVFGIIYGLPFEKTEKLEYVTKGDMKIPFYFPSSTMETFTIDSNSISKRSLTAPEAVAFGTNELANHLGLSVSELKIKQSHKDAAGVTHIYASRKINGIVVDNHVASIHIRGKQVLSFTSSFKNTDNFVEPEIVPPVVIVSLEDAVKKASRQLGAPRDNHPASTVYTQLPSGKITYAHQFQLRDDKKVKWFQVVVDASTGQLLQVVDYYQEYTYKALKLPKTNPFDGGFEKVVDPYKLAKNASPKGWHNDGKKTYIDTKGNNVVSQINGVTLNGTVSGEFTHQWDANKDPATEENQKAAIINNFYRILCLTIVSNMLHDISYQYGFTEEAGNFQNNNFGKVGMENDAVVINNQAMGTNNANFGTPPDGQAPTMNMYRFTGTIPNRDGSLDNVIPLHEYTHGISTRMTGGSHQGNCLFSTESRGLGEGWSDTVATLLTRKAGEDRTLVVAPGFYVLNRPTGVRKYVYSTNTNFNPLMYGDTKGLISPHEIGTIWATMLYELYWNLVDKYGFSPNYYDVTQNAGNIKAMRLVFGGFPLQPCNPTFITARDAILLADKNHYGGENKCLIWKAFAKRGLGVGAEQSFEYVNDFKLPKDCTA